LSFLEEKVLDTLRYARKLEKVGISRDQAEFHIRILSEIMENNLATQQELKDLRHELMLLRKEVRQHSAVLEQRLTVKLGTMVSLAVGLAFTLAKPLH
jgi:hypothetical protein